MSDLKSFFDNARVERIGRELHAAWPEFPRARFVREATDGLDALELMDRARHISAAMARALPTDYPEALAIVLRALGPPLASEGNGMEAFHHQPHANFVAERGLDHPEISLAAMREITSRSSCEFAIRPFLERHPDLALRTLRAWTSDPDEHVRRLVSEGTRPRLPWASRLRALQRDPTPALALLETLRDDPSGYVRRSVANHLNDVSKDHPALVLSTCARWLADAGPERRRLVAHALRTLVRKGDPEAVRLVGGDAHAHFEARGKILPARPRIGERIRAEIEVSNLGIAPASAVLTLRIHFVKAGGGSSPRTFKLPTLSLAAGETRAVSKLVSLAQQTTRTHHPGEHVVEVLVNGDARPLGRFTLLREAPGRPSR